MLHSIGLYSTPLKTPALPRFGNDHSRPPRLSESDLHGQVASQFEKKGYHPTPKGLPKETWKGCGNIPLMLLLAFCGYLGYGRGMSLYRGPDFSQRSAPAHRLYEKLAGEEKLTITSGQSSIIFNELIEGSEAFRKLDPGDKAKLENQFNSVLTEVSEMKTQRTDNIGMNILALAGLAIIGLGLTMVISCRTETGDRSLELLTHLAISPKRFVEGLRQKQYTIKELDAYETIRLAESLVRSGELAASLHHQLVSVLGQHPELSHQLEEVYGHVPTAEEMLQGFLQQALDAFPDQVEKRASKNKVVNLPDVAQSLEELMDAALKTGYLLSGLTARVSEADRLKAKLAMHTVAQACNQNHLKLLNEELETAQAKLVGLASESSLDADEKLLAAGAERARIQARIKEVEGFAQLAGNLKRQTYVEILTSQAVPVASGHAAMQRILATHLPELSQEHLELLTMGTGSSEAADSPETLRLKLAADSLLDTLPKENTSG